MKIAVLRARHDSSKPYPSDRACIEMVMTNAQHTSVFNYWEKVTDGYLDFVGSNLFPWVDISLGLDNVSRGTQCDRALAATAALPGALLDGYDGFFVLSWPGQIKVRNPLEIRLNRRRWIVTGLDAGAGPTLKGKPACAIPIMTSNHTFMCHELGHVMAFQHSYGVLNNGVDWDGVAPFTEGEVYGDPYDIMSSATFGTRQLDPSVSRYRGSPTFVGATVAEWPDLNAFSMGPAPARAHVHLWDAAALKPQQVVHRPVPAAGQTVNFTLTAAGRAGGAQLIVLHPTGEDGLGRGRCYIEYRQQGGWDAGLDVAGMDLARQAVVVHTLADTAESVRCWYRGRILVPLEIDSDLNVTGTPLTVRLHATNVDAGTVEISVSSGVNRGIEIHQRGSDDTITTLDPQPMSTPCGDPITFGTHIMQSQYFYQPISYGFGGFGAPDAGALKARWTVAGVPATGATGTLQAPTPDGTFAIEYALDPITAELSLSSRGGERYRVDVTITLTEADGTGATSATAVFAPVGYFEGYGPGDQLTITRCMAKYAKRAQLHLRDYLIPPGPNPLWNDRVERINEERVRHVINRAATRNRGAAQALSALHAMRYGGR